jgi:copper chaperone CopZ
MAMILVIGCASEKKMESQTAEAPQEAGAKTDATAITPAAYEEITLSVDGMTCGACPAKVQSALIKLPGVISADVSLADGKAVVKREKGKAEVAQLTEAVKQAGFGAEATN